MVPTIMSEQPPNGLWVSHVGKPRNKELRLPDFDPFYTGPEPIRFSAEEEKWLHANVKKAAEEEEWIGGEWKDQDPQPNTNTWSPFYPAAKIASEVPSASKQYRTHELQSIMHRLHGKNLIVQSRDGTQIKQGVIGRYWPGDETVEINFADDSLRFKAEYVLHRIRETVQGHKVFLLERHSTTAPSAPPAPVF